MPRRIKIDMIGDYYTWHDFVEALAEHMPDFTPEASTVTRFVKETKEFVDIKMSQYCEVSDDT